MTRSTVLGALAIASVLVAGCQDDRALGAERNGITPSEMPPANDHRPLDEPSVPGTSDPMGTTQSPRTPTGWLQEGTPATDPTPEAMNGEDLASIPELHEPIWATVADGETHRASKRPSVAAEPSACVAGPSGQEREENSEPAPR
jgi:hypothetical protein